MEERVGSSSLLFDRVTQAALAIDRQGTVTAGDASRIRLCEAVEAALAADQGGYMSHKLATHLRLGHVMGQCARAVCAGAVADPWLGASLLALAAKCPRGVAAPKSFRKGIAATRNVLGVLLGPDEADRLVDRAFPTGATWEASDADAVGAELRALFPVSGHPASPQLPDVAAAETHLAHAVIDAVVDVGAAREEGDEDEALVSALHDTLVQTTEAAGMGPWEPVRGARVLMAASEALLSDTREGKQALREWRGAAQDDPAHLSLAEFATEIGSLKRVISAVAALEPVVTYSLFERCREVTKMAAAWMAAPMIPDAFAESAAELVTHSAPAGGALAAAARLLEAELEQGRVERAQACSMDVWREEEEARKEAVAAAAEARVSVLAQELGESGAGLDGRQVVARAAGLAAWEATRKVDLADPPAVPAVAPETEAAVARWLEGILTRAEPSPSQAAAREAVFNRASRLCRDGDTLYLFGSSASGFGTPHSDIDMCMVVDEGEAPGQQADRQMSRQSAKRVRVPAMACGSGRCISPSWLPANLLSLFRPR